VQHTVLDARLDALGIHAVRDAEATLEVAHVVLRVDRSQIVVRVERHATLEGEHAVVQLHLDGVLIDSGQVHRQPHAVGALADVGIGLVRATRARALGLVHGLLHGFLGHLKSS